MIYIICMVFPLFIVLWDVLWIDLHNSQTHRDTWIRIRNIFFNILKTINYFKACARANKLMRIIGFTDPTWPVNDYNTHYTHIKNIKYLNPYFKLEKVYYSIIGVGVRRERAL